MAGNIPAASFNLSDIVSAANSANASPREDTFEYGLTAIAVVIDNGDVTRLSSKSGNSLYLNSGPEALISANESVDTIEKMELPPTAFLTTSPYSCALSIEK